VARISGQGEGPPQVLGTLKQHLRVRRSSLTLPPPLRRGCGCQLGSWVGWPLVSSTWSVPSALAFHSVAYPAPRVLSKAIRLPFGDQARLYSWAPSGVLVTLAGSPPPASTA
jgi:hypothetical protein